MNQRSFLGGLLLVSAALLGVHREVWSACSTQAFLVSGGGGPSSNHCDYYENLDRGIRALDSQGTSCVSTFAARGPIFHEQDLASVRAQGDRSNDRNCFLPPSPRPELFRGGRRPDAEASFSAIQARMKQRLAADSSQAPVLLYFTDHGGRNSTGNESTIALWEGTQLTQAQVRELVALVPPSRKVIVVNDQCFGGGIVSGLFTGDLDLPENVCGFSMAQAGEYAFSGGGFMRGAERLSSQGKQYWDRDGDGAFSYREVYGEILERDQTHSTPQSTSDLFLSRYYGRHSLYSNQTVATMRLGCWLQSERVLDHFSDSMNRVLLAEELSRQDRELSDCQWGIGTSFGTKDVATYLAEAQRKEDELLKLDGTTQAASQSLRTQRKALMWALFESGCPRTSSLTTDLACPRVGGVSNVDRLRSSQSDLDELELYQKNSEIYCQYVPEFSCCQGEQFRRSEGLGEVPCATGVPALQVELQQLKEGRDLLWSKVKAIPATGASAQAAGIPPEFEAQVQAVAEARKEEEEAESRWRAANIAASQIRRCSKAALNLAALRSMASENDSEAFERYLRIQRCEQTPFMRVPVAPTSTSSSGARRSR